MPLWTEVCPVNVVHQSMPLGVARGPGIGELMTERRSGRSAPNPERDFEPTRTAYAQQWRADACIWVGRRGSATHVRVRSRIRRRTATISGNTGHAIADCLALLVRAGSGDRARRGGVTG